MKDTPIPDVEFLVRFVKKRDVIWSDDLKTALGISGDAFRLRENDDGYLSAAWEGFYDVADSPVTAQAIAKFSTFMTVKKHDRFVRGNVGDIKSACAERNCSVRVVNEPDGDHLAHAAVRRFRDDDPILLDLLATVAWAQIVS